MCIRACVRTSILSYRFHRPVHTITPRVFGVSGLPLDPDSARGHGLGTPFHREQHWAHFQRYLPGIAICPFIGTLSFMSCGRYVSSYIHAFISFFLSFHSFVHVSSKELKLSFSSFFHLTVISFHEKTFLFVRKYRLGRKPENGLSVFFFNFISVLSSL